MHRITLPLFYQISASHFMSKELPFNNINQINSFQETLWQALNLLRGVSQSPDYFVLLYLLILHRDGFLKVCAR